MRVLRVYITGSSPVTCTNPKNRMKSKKAQISCGFFFVFSQKHFYVLKLIFAKLSRFLSKCNTICNTLITSLIKGNHKKF